MPASSAVHEVIDGLLVVIYPKMCSLISGVLNLKSPKPRCMFVWDVKKVLDFIKEKLGNNDRLPDKELTL